MKSINTPPEIPAASTLPKLGIIAGSGDLPERVIQAVSKTSRAVFVLAFEGETDAPSIGDVPHAWLHLGSIGKALSLLKQEEVEEIVLAGRIQRPVVSALRLDVGGLKLLSRILKTQLYGDNAIFSTIVRFLEEKGFKVVAVNDVLVELLAPTGVLGSVQPSEEAWKDIKLGARAAKHIGSLDIGQAVVVQRGVVLGVEAIEGTDALLARAGSLAQSGGGGVLVKMKKPNQESRIDLPAIGVATVENAHAAGLEGIALEAGGALIIDKAAVVEKADQLGLFITGIDAGAASGQDNA